MDEDKPPTEDLDSTETARPQSPILPQRIGPYRLLQKLGEGDMGEVYEARQVSLNRRVALKVLQETQSFLRFFSTVTPAVACSSLAGSAIKPPPHCALRDPATASGIGRTLVPALLVLLLGSPALATSQTTPPLEEILPRLSRMADLYIGAAFEFSCVEVVRSIDYNEAGRVDGRGLIRNNYLYSGSEEGLREVRAPTKVKSLDDVEGRMQKRGAWLYLDRAYFWTLMFHESRSGMMEYALEPHEPKKGARTVRISFRPLPPVVKDANDWYGSAIVDLDTYQLLHAEGYKTDDYERRRRLLELMESDEELPVAVDDRTFVVIKVATEFGEEKNGLRLPSRVAVTKTKFRVKGPAGQRRWREIPIGKVRQTYKDYRFYRVWSTQQVHAHMLGKDAALASPQPERATPETAAPQEKTVADDADWPETGPPPPGIAYEESFDWSMDNEEAVREWESKGWLIGFSEKGIWTGEVSDGVYRLSNRHHESESYTQTLSFGEDRGDAPIATRVMLERITRRGRPAAGLLYRYTPGTIPLYYVYVLTHSGDVEFRRRTEGGFKLLYRAPVDDFEWGRFHELRIAGSGDSFELWLDGELLTVVSDEGLRGLPGIFASGRGRYVFDDLTLFFP